MPASIDVSSSTSVCYLDKWDYNDRHFKWNSIKKFIYLACTHSVSVYNFDIFSKVCNKLRIYDFILCEVVIGMTYSVMNCFIVQYTRKLDCGRLLNPLLRGISYGQFLQTALWTLIHAEYVADSLRFLVTSLQAEPSWQRCHKSYVNMSCITSHEIVNRCQDSQHFEFNSTSAHFNYLKSFSDHDRGVITARFFVIALVWIFNFFIATVTDETLVKIFRLAFVCRLFSTLIAIIFLALSTKYMTLTAFSQILDASGPFSLTRSVEHVTYIYGVGFLGLPDFGAMSPYTMIDNAVVIFTILFTTTAFIRSWIVRVLYLVLTKCVKVGTVSPHYLLFAVLPLSTEFLEAHKLYILYIYLNVFVATTAYLAMLTLTMAKLLHSEFRSVKNIYLVGLLCLVGFGLSIPATVSMKTSTGMKGLISGLNVTVLYLGGFRVAIVMWIYGVRRFSTDINFWLGFNPPKFWTIFWVLLPILLWIFMIKIICKLTTLTDLVHSLSAAAWIIFTLIVVGIFHFKTAAKYLMRNNLAGVFKSSIKYGPPEPDDRKRRRNFNETIQLRQCKHNCNMLDEMFYCNHLPLIQKSPSNDFTDSQTSLKSIYEGGTKMRTSTHIIDLHSYH